jgi:hypothetical protein
MAWRVRESSKLGAPRPPPRWLEVEADARDRHQEILEILRWLCPGELAIGNNYDSILAVPGHHCGPSCSARSTTSLNRALAS